MNENFENPGAAKSDATTTVAELREQMRKFVAQRDWEKFHQPKNLAMSIAIETAELMEHFQWRDHDQCKAALEDPETLQEVKDEISDIFAYLLSLTNALDIDLSQTFRDKMVRVEKKYPDGTFEV